MPADIAAFTLRIVKYVFCDFVVVVDFIMDRKLAQRGNVEFCVKFTSTLNMLQQAYGIDIMDLEQ